MRLLGCDTKYTNGEASDFECFREWISAFCMLNGNDTAERFATELGNILGRSICVDELAKCDPRLLWQEYSVMRHGSEFSENTVEKHNYVFSGYKNIYCDEKNKKIKKSLDINELIKIKDFDFDIFCKTLKNTNYDSIFAKFSEESFKRPDRYRAGEISKKNIRGEKLNCSENNILISQIIFENIFANKCEKIQIHIFSSNTLLYECGLIEYMSFRGLRARIYIHVTKGNSAEEVRELCLAARGDCFVTPIFEGEDTVGFKESLARIYPIGLLG